MEAGSRSVGPGREGCVNLGRDSKTGSAPLWDYPTQTSEMSLIQFLVWIPLCVTFQERVQYVTFVIFHILWKVKQKTHSNAGFFPTVCNFTLNLVTSRSTFPLQHPLIVPAWCFCLQSWGFHSQMLFFLSNTSRKHRNHWQIWNCLSVADCALDTSLNERVRCPEA